MSTLQNMIERLPDMGSRPFLIKLEKKDHQAYDYANLSKTARRLAFGLIRHGIKPGSIMGFFGPLDFSWITACLGVLQTGGVVMPLDLQLEKKILAGILKDSKPCCIFAGAGQLEKLRQFAHQDLPIYLLDGVNQHADSWQRLFTEDKQSLPEISPQDPAALFYTSGTTGTPKGVPLSHGNLAFQISTVRQTGLIKTDDRILLPLPPHHAYPFVIGILAPLSLGLTIVLPYALTGPQMVRALRQGEITLLLGVPRLYEALYAGISSRFESHAITRWLFRQGLRGGPSVFNEKPACRLANGCSDPFA